MKYICIEENCPARKGEYLDNKPCECIAYNAGDVYSRECWWDGRMIKMLPMDGI